MAKELRFSTESMQGRRKQNQDSVLAERFPEDGLLLAVADGMGGHAAGEVASALALETLLKAIRAGESLEDAVRLANWQVHKKAQDPNRLGMGTTLTVMHLKDDRFHLANVGDSRAYRVSRRGIRQLTHDHSFVAEALKRGQTQEVALASPWKDALTRSIGTEEEVEVDVFGPFAVEDDTALLLCSDGLYKALEPGEIWNIFMASEDIHQAAQVLAATAYEQGSDDNITVAIAEFGAFPRRQVANRSQAEAWSRREERRGRRDLGEAWDMDLEGGIVAGESGEGSETEAGVEGQTASRNRKDGGIGGKDEMGAEMAANAREIGLVPRRRRVDPWEFTPTSPPRIVGGPKQRKAPWKRVLFGVLAVILAAAAAAFFYFR